MDGNLSEFHPRRLVSSRLSRKRVALTSQLTVIEFVILAKASSDALVIAAAATTADELISSR